MISVTEPTSEPVTCEANDEQFKALVEQFEDPFVLEVAYNEEDAELKLINYENLYK